MSVESEDTMHNIFKFEIEVIDILMQKMNWIIDAIASETVYTETWQIEDLQLNKFHGYEECYNNFQVGV